jgi:hypothetical protein
VRVQEAAVTVSAAKVILTCASREGPHPTNKKQTEINRKQTVLKDLGLRMLFLLGPQDSLIY